MAEPVRDEEGNLKNFTLKIAGKPFRCRCGCNVFTKPDKEDDNQFKCNGCGFVHITND